MIVQSVIPPPQPSISVQVKWAGGQTDSAACRRLSRPTQWQPDSPDLHFRPQFASYSRSCVWSDDSAEMQDRLLQWGITRFFSSLFPHTHTHTLSQRWCFRIYHPRPICVLSQSICEFYVYIFPLFKSVQLLLYQLSAAINAASCWGLTTLCL